MGLTIIPAELSGFTEGEERLANKIKSLYAAITRDCYLYAKPRLRNLEPDFILIDPAKGICILEVKDWELNYIAKIDRVWVTTIHNQRIHSPSNRANQYFNFAKSLFEMDSRLLDDEGCPAYKLFSKVIFTNMNSEDASTIFVLLDQFPTKCIFSNQIKNLTHSDFFDNESCYISAQQLFVLRGILFPEIKIHDDAIENAEGINSKGIADTIKVLDSEQEQFAKRISHGHYMVSGVPGSGKTVILLARAIFLLKENPEWKIQIVTYNRSLKNKIQNRINHLAHDLKFLGLHPENIFVSTFHKLASDVSAIPIPQNADDEFWTHELPLAAYEKATPTYDAMLIDEYQDFYDVWMRVPVKLTMSCRSKLTTYFAGEDL